MSSIVRPQRPLCVSQILALGPLTAFELQYEDDMFCRLPSRQASPPLKSAGTLVVCNRPLLCTPLGIRGDNNYGIGITSKICGGIGMVNWIGHFYHTIFCGFCRWVDICLRQARRMVGGLPFSWPGKRACLAPARNMGRKSGHSSGRYLLWDFVTGPSNL